MECSCICKEWMQYVLTCIGGMRKDGNACKWEWRMRLNVSVDGGWDYM